MVLYTWYTKNVNRILSEVRVSANTVKQLHLMWLSQAFSSEEITSATVWSKTVKQNLSVFAKFNVQMSAKS